jgi:hypothetical protein
MSQPNSPTDQPSEWHVLLRGERLGPFPRHALRALLDTHPDGYQASVWRLGMLDWRAAANVSALTSEAAASEPPSVSYSRADPSASSAAAPQAARAARGAEVDPPSPSAVFSRDTAGELRVLSYEERKELPREPRVDVAPARSIAPILEVTGEWSTVATGELRAFGTSELVALSGLEPSPALTGEWASVATSELRAIGTSELRVLARNPSSTQSTLSELRAVATGDLLRESARTSVIFSRAQPSASTILSAETATELPSFTFRAERDVLSAARGAATPTLPAPRERDATAARTGATTTPRDLRAYSAPPASRPPSRLALLVMSSLLVLSAGALGTSLTLRLLRASEPQPRAYPRAPLPPQPVETRAPEPEHTSDPVAVAPVLDAAPAEPTQRREAKRPAKRSRKAEDSADTWAASRVDSVRVAAPWANVRAGNDAAAKVVCALPSGSVRPVLAELPGAQGRWFAVRCDARAAGWVQEQDLAPVEARGPAREQNEARGPAREQNEARGPAREQNEARGPAREQNEARERSRLTESGVRAAP